MKRLTFSVKLWTKARLTTRGITTNGRITNEDRRWWLIHLECAPDITPGTFVSWLDCCGTHTTKKLIERNIWTIEQVAELDSDEVDELKYKEGCLKVDITWEHARTIITPLRQRAQGNSVESELQNRISDLRKKRELERKREEILQERSVVSDNRAKMLQELRETIAAKKAELRRKMEEQQKSAQSAISGGVDATADHGSLANDHAVEAVLERMGPVVGVPGDEQK